MKWKNASDVVWLSYTIKAQGTIIKDYNKVINALRHIMVDNQTSTRAKINVAELIMLCWMCEHERNDKIENEDIKRWS